MFCVYELFMWKVKIMENVYLLGLYVLHIYLKLLLNCNSIAVKTEDALLMSHYEMGLP